MRRDPKVSILVPHYQTPDLTLLCLRLIRRLTAKTDYETIVIDNGSEDGSGQRLKRLKWIRLLRRDVGECETVSQSHGLALNLGVGHAQAPNILTIHTDTMVRHQDWLAYLLDGLNHGGSDCGMVGSWKMESKNWIRRTGKWMEKVCREMRGKPTKTKCYPRTHCALYRREVLEKRPQMFLPSHGRSAGEELFTAATQAGYRCQFLPVDELSRYVVHLNHATMALNEELGEQDRYLPRTRARAVKRIREFFDSIGAKEILADDSLDA